MYYGHIETIHKCPDYLSVLIIQFSLHAKVLFVTITKCVDYAGVLIFKCPDIPRPACIYHGFCIFKILF